MKQLVILGTGFGGFSVLKKIDLKQYDVAVISERNHFLFTPLLPSTTVGTIEFRSIIEPVRLARKNVTFYQARASALDVQTQTVRCEDVIDGHVFDVGYDVLVVAVGAVNHTFGVPGVEANAFFLKELRDARKIRQRIIDHFEHASIPGLPSAEVQRLLHFVVAGGGPTGVEFAAELADFLEEELEKAFPHLVGTARITLVEAGRHILSSFDREISEYAVRLFNRRRVTVLTHQAVEEVSSQQLRLQDDSVIPYGVLVWSTGNAPTSFVRQLPFVKDPAGRMMVDGYFAVPETKDVYAIGDCANRKDSPLVATAQVAGQAGKYLARLLNRMAKTGCERTAFRPFVYKHLGMLAYIGDYRAVADLPKAKSRGFSTWIFWRSAYLTRLVSWKNKAMVIFDWSKAFLFGRDVSRF